jgi:hypothetical protein
VVLPRRQIEVEPTFDKLIPVALVFSVAEDVTQAPMAACQFG